MLLCFKAGRKNPRAREQGRGRGGSSQIKVGCKKSPSGNIKFRYG